MTTISKDKQYRTRDGREARVLATDIKGRYPVLAAVQNLNGTEAIYALDERGMHYVNAEQSPFDLIEVKPRFRIERWVNVYSNPSSMSYLYKTKAKALGCTGYGRIATKRIIIEGTEGEDDEEGK